jgi:hypothetical protein
LDVRRFFSARGLAIGRHAIVTAGAPRQPLGGRDILGTMTKWLVMMALLVGCTTQETAQPDLKTTWTGQPRVQVDSSTGRGEDLTAGWHWYDYVFSIPLGMAGFYDPASAGK